jgi:hypothetical protein
MRSCTSTPHMPSQKAQGQLYLYFVFMALHPLISLALLLSGSHPPYGFNTLRFSEVGRRKIHLILLRSSAIYAAGDYCLRRQHSSAWKPYYCTILFTQLCFCIPPTALLSNTIPHTAVLVERRKPIIYITKIKICSGEVTQSIPLLWRRQIGCLLYCREEAFIQSAQIKF